MAYKTISVVITDELSDLNALATARDYAAREAAHLDVHCVGIDPARYDPMPIGSAAVLNEVGIKEAQNRAAALEKWALSHLSGDKSLITVHPVVIPQMGLDALVARLARYSDLIVATKPYGEGRNPLHVSVLESELFGTRAPVLVVPATAASGAKPYRRVAVAWNESSESFSAIRAAMPILKQASAVDLLMIDPPSHSPERSDPGGAMCMMLSRHGVRAEVSILARTMPRVSDVLARFATEHACDLIVMGAYGHSRFRESILGGATRDMLEHSEIPLLMAH